MSSLTIDKPRIVVMGGGTGAYTLLRGLRKKADQLLISAIIAVTDNGGSSRVLRDHYGVLPFGDLNQALAALSDREDELREVFAYRYEWKGLLEGHKVSNLLLQACVELCGGDMNAAIKKLGKILGVRGRVIPVSLDNLHLCALSEQGQRIDGEHQIENALYKANQRLKSLWIQPQSNQINPLAHEAILNADLIVIGPGSLFTSILPILLINGVTEALSQTRATIVYVANLMCEAGNTSDYAVQDYAQIVIDRMEGRAPDYVIANNRRPSAAMLEKYRAESERGALTVDRKRTRGLPYTLVTQDLLQHRPEGTRSTSDALGANRSLIRHNSDKIAEVLFALCLLRHAEARIIDHKIQPATRKGA